MIFDLGQSLIGSELIRVTAEYSNAVLVAVMPYISDVTQKLDLPLQRPITVEHVTHCSIIPQRKIGVEIGIRGGWVFAFNRGHITTIQSDQAYSVLQDPEKIPKFFWENSTTKSEAVKIARDTLKKLDIPLESVFADEEPQITEPWKVGTNTVPRYYIGWLDPVGRKTVDIEVNGNTKRVERIRLNSKKLDRPPPYLSVSPQSEPHQTRCPEINPEYAERLTPFVLSAIDNYGSKLSLPLPRPLTTNHVTRFSLQENNGGPYCELELTNGWRFLFEHDMVTAYYDPDCLLASIKEPLSFKHYAGKWNMSEADAIQLVKQTLAKLNYPANLTHVDFVPRVSKSFSPDIPRYMFRWDYSLEGDTIVRSAVAAEVDAAKREVKSLYYGDISFWNKKLPIDVPIILPLSISTPSGSKLESNKAQKGSKPPPRAFVPFDLTPK